MTIVEVVEENATVIEVIIQGPQGPPGPPGSPEFTNLIEGEVPKADANLIPVPSGAAVDPVTGVWTFDNDVIMSGDLIVQGTTTTVDSESLIVTDSYIDLNASYTIAAPKTGGLVVNCEATGVGDTVTAGDFTAGVASTSNPTAVTDGPLDLDACIKLPNKLTSI